MSVSNHSTKKDAGTFAREVRATFPVVFDPKGTIFTRYSVDAIPANIIINRQGKVVKSILGGDVPAVEAAIASALK